MQLTIIIPILNEKELLYTAFKNLKKTLDQFGQNKIKVMVCDGGSTDGSVNLGQSACRKLGWTYIFSALDQPSIAKTINLGMDQTTDQNFLILPVDCRIRKIHLEKLNDLILNNKSPIYGGFLKRYHTNNIIYNWYALLQNCLYFEFSDHIFWTNGFWIIQNEKNGMRIPEHGFLEDIFLSQKLKAKNFKRKLIPYPIEVSPRRYKKDGFIKRVLLNFYILFSFNFTSTPLEKLKAIYLGK